MINRKLAVLLTVVVSSLGSEAVRAESDYKNRCFLLYQEQWEMAEADGGGDWIGLLPIVGTPALLFRKLSKMDKKVLLALLNESHSGPDARGDESEIASLTHTVKWDHPDATVEHVAATIRKGIRNGDLCPRQETMSRVEFKEYVIERVPEQIKSAAFSGQAVEQEFGQSSDDAR